MTELLLYSLIFGLFLVAMITFRILVQRQVKQVLKTLDVDINSKEEAVKVRPVTNPSFILQESTERLKD